MPRFLEQNRMPKPLSDFPEDPEPEDEYIRKVRQEERELARPIVIEDAKNCRHSDPAAWERMVKERRQQLNVKKDAKEKKTKVGGKV